jgi:hypothetical protein
MSGLGAAPLFELEEREADGFEGIVVVVFHLDDLPFDRADGINSGEERREIHEASAEFLFVLQVDEGATRAEAAKELSGVLAGEFYPVNVYLGGEVVGSGGGKQVLEGGLAGVLREFAVMVVIVELESVAVQTGPDGGQFAAKFSGGGGSGEKLFGHPRANDVGGADAAGIEDEVGEVAAQDVYTHVHTRAFEAGALQRGGDASGIEVAKTGELDALKTKGGELGDGASEVFGDVIAHRPELNGDGDVGGGGHGGWC